MPKETIAIASDHAGFELKAQLKEAVRLGARFAAVLGPDEWSRGEVTLKNLSTGAQEVLELKRAEALIGSS